MSNSDFPYSRLKAAWQAGCADAKARKDEDQRKHFGELPWGPLHLMYYRGFRAGCIGRPVDALDMDRVVKRACGCLTWDYAPKVATDDELGSFLQRHMSEGGGSGPGGMSYWYNGSGLKVWASWVRLSPRGKEDLICSGKSTIAIARRVYNIEQPSGQLGLL